MRRIVAAGTSALRDAANGPAFIRRVRRELGFTIRTLSGVEEARYGFLGAVGGLPVEHGALFDLGGGSLQVARFRERRLLGAVSVPLGALRVSDAFLKSDPPTPREMRRLREHAREVLDAAGVRALSAGEELVGTGGTLRNLAKIDQRACGLPDPAPARVRAHPARGSTTIVAGLAGERLKKRARVPGLNADRRDSVVGGGLVIDTLVEALGADHVVVSGEGVREGLARSLAQETLEPTAAVRRSSLDALASRFVGWSAERARRREAVASALHAALDPGRPARRRRRSSRPRGSSTSGARWTSSTGTSTWPTSCSPPTSPASRTGRWPCSRRSCARRATRRRGRARSPRS